MIPIPPVFNRNPSHLWIHLIPTRAGVWNCIHVVWMRSSIAITTSPSFSNTSVARCQRSKPKPNSASSVEITNWWCWDRRIFIPSLPATTGVIQVRLFQSWKVNDVCLRVEFLDGNYLNSRRNDLITDDRLRVYVRVVLVDEKEMATGDLLRHPHLPHHHHHHHHHHPPNSLLPPPPPPPPAPTAASLSQPSLASAPHAAQPQPQQQASAIPKTQASTSSSSASSSSATAITNSNPSSTSSTSLVATSGLFSDDKERFKSLELFSSQVKTLLDDERFADVNIHIIPKQQQYVLYDEHKKPNRTKHARASFKPQQQPSCSSCHCAPEKSKTLSSTNEQIPDHHDQSSSSGSCERLCRGKDKRAIGVISRSSC